LSSSAQAGVGAARSGELGAIRPGVAALAEAVVEYVVTPTVPQQSRAKTFLFLAVLRRCGC
jgi:hypothetical protein